MQQYQAMGGYLFIFLLQFASPGLKGNLVFGSLFGPQLAKLLGNVTDGDSRMRLLDTGTVVRAEHEERRTGEKRGELIKCQKPQTSFLHMKVAKSLNTQTTVWRRF